MYSNGYVLVGWDKVDIWWAAGGKIINFDHILPHPVSVFMIYCHYRCKV